MSFVYQVRRDTAANWTAANPTLLQGEWALETDTSRAKLGDGVTAWSSLGYFLADEIADAVAAVVDGAPGALNTLNELAAALDDDASFASSVTTVLSGKAPLASPALTGTPSAPTAAAGTSTTQIATTEFVSVAVAAATPGTGSITSDMIANGAIVDADVSASAEIAQSKIAGLTSDLSGKAPLASPALTGTPTAPTAAPGTDSTQVATTAFVAAALSSVDTGPVVSVSASQPGSFDGGDLWLDTSAAV